MYRAVYFFNGGLRMLLIHTCFLIARAGASVGSSMEGVVSQRACSWGVELCHVDIVWLGVMIFFVSEGCEHMLLVICPCSGHHLGWYGRAGRQVEGVYAWGHGDHGREELR